MKKIISQDLINKLNQANEDVKGTDRYYTFRMQMEWKNPKNKRWYFLGIYPINKYLNAEYYFKAIGNEEYVYCKRGEELERWLLTDDVKRVLNLEVNNG